MGLSLSHLLLVGVVVFVLFGAGRLPSLMSDLAKGLRAFKTGMREEEDLPPSLPKTSKRKKPR
jgi:sec-independent protein translocase protein TatA